MGKSLLTIGYEGSSLADFLETLRRASVEILIDVRDVPISRKAGFSKNALSDALDSSGISYLHLKQLGDPKEGREAARAGDISEFKRIYAAWIKRPEARDELKQAVSEAKKARACLLCYERDPKTCHRLMVAERMSNLAEFQIVHLGVREGAAKQRPAGSGMHERQRIRKVG